MKITISNHEEIHMKQRNLSEIKEIMKSVVKSTEITKSQLKSGDFEITYTFFRVSDPSTKYLLEESLERCTCCIHMVAEL